MDPRFNEVAGDWPNLFVKWRVRYIENLNITNLRGNDQNVRDIAVIVASTLYSGCKQLAIKYETEAQYSRVSLSKSLTNLHFLSFNWAEMF